MVHSPDCIPKFVSLIQPNKMPRDLPRPKRVELRYGVDHSGEEAFYIYLIFPDSVSDEAISWKHVEPLFDWVHGKIWEASQEQTFPYIHVRRESEML